MSDETWEQHQERLETMLRALGVKYGRDPWSYLHARRRPAETPTPLGSYREPPSMPVCRARTRWDRVLEWVPFIPREFFALGGLPSRARYVIGLTEREEDQAMELKRELLDLCDWCTNIACDANDGRYCPNGPVARAGTR